MFRLNIFENECEVDVESLVFDQVKEPAQERKVRTKTQAWAYGTGRGGCEVCTCPPKVSGPEFWPPNEQPKTSDGYLSIS